jgi:hypothetical protein
VRTPGEMIPGMAEMSAQRSPETQPRRASRVKRVGLVTLMALCVANVWTGSPLLALWWGSRVQGGGPPTMAAVGVAAVTLGIQSFILVRILNALGMAYDKAVGVSSGPRRQVPWLRSMRGERPHQQASEVRFSALDKLLIAAVVVAVAAFEIWFFFFSGSPIGQTTGRD